MKRERYTDFDDPDGRGPGMIARIGKIGLGVKVATKKGGERPMECDFFVFDDPSVHFVPDVLVEQGRIKAETATLWKAGKAGPKKLPIMFTAECRSMIAPRALERWGTNVKLCSGNGREAQQVIVRDDSQNGLESVACPCQHLDDGKCKRQLRLMVMLPHVDMSGCFQIDTTSRASIDRIYSDLDQIERLFGGVSLLMDPDTGEPMLDMVRVPWKSATDGQTHYAISIRPRQIDMRQLAVFRGRRAQRILAGAMPQPLLPMPGAEKPRSQNGNYLNGDPAPVIDLIGDVPDGVDPETGEILPTGGDDDDDDLNPGALLGGGGDAFDPHETTFQGADPTGFSEPRPATLGKKPSLF
ncbi:MAG TPA: hypothetical protein VM487_20950 [Phycisphaerae bacterium]|nr:hypothetical protein [Phycisphaerae bacterium]